MVAVCLQRIYDEGEGGKFISNLEILKGVVLLSFHNLQKGRVVLAVGESNKRCWQESETSMAHHPQLVELAPSTISPCGYVPMAVSYLRNPYVCFVFVRFRWRSLVMISGINEKPFHVRRKEIMVFLWRIVCWSICCFYILRHFSFAYGNVFKNSGMEFNWFCMLACLWKHICR